MKTAIATALTTALSSLAVLVPTGAFAQDAIDTIVFGSCAREREEQPIWTEVIAKNPDLFLFIGDNTYADFWVKNGEMVMAPVEDPARIVEAYDELARKPGYRRLQREVPIMATWDDHDYGKNDGGVEYPLKRDAQDAFLNFFGFRDNDPIRSQDGIYHSRTFGPDGQRVQIIMLDTRYHRDSLDSGERQPGTGPYVPTRDRSRSMLGEAQWKWLEQQLREDADVRIVVSSIQVVAWEHGWETWGNMPHERQRLFDLIDRTNASGVVFLSGDRHLMELSVDAGSKVENHAAEIRSDTPYPMWDFTSSGLTQRPSPVDEKNTYRVGPVLRETNFGVVRIHWDGDRNERTTIALEGFGDQGQMLTRQTIWLRDLKE